MSGVLPLAVRIHVSAKLRDLARIETDLIDDEVRAALDLLLELHVLRNDFAFTQFEIGGDSTDAELRSPSRWPLLLDSLAQDRGSFCSAAK